MDVDDLLVGVRVDPDGVEFLQLVSDGDDDVGAVEPEVHVVAAHEADGADAVGVVVGHHALTVEGVRHRNTEVVGEANQCLGGVAARGTVARQHHRPLGVAQHLDRAVHLCSRRRLGADDVARQGRQVVVGFVGVDVLGDGEVDSGRAFGFCHLERLAEHLRDRARRGNAVGPSGDGGEHRHQVDVLMRLLVLAVLAHLSRDRDQRGAVRRGVGDAQLHVDGTRTQRRRHHGRPPGDAAVHLGHERRTLFMAGENVADRRRGQRLDEADVLLTRQPENHRNTLVFQALDHQLGGCRHPPPPPATIVARWTHAHRHDQPDYRGDGHDIHPGHQ